MPSLRIPRPFASGLVSAIGALGATGLLLSASPAGAADVPLSGRLDAALTRAVEADQRAARETEALAAEEAEALEVARNTALRNQMLRLEVEKLERFTTELAARIERRREAQRRYDEIALLIDADLVRALDKLEEAVADDLPFATTERTERLAFLRGTLADPDVTVGEKTRRVLEALNVEAAYGTSTETSTETTTLDGRETTLRVVRIGRTALFAETLDRTTVALWDPKVRTFRSTPDAQKAVTALFDELTNRSVRNVVQLPISAEVVRRAHESAQAGTPSNTPQGE